MNLQELPKKVKAGYIVVKKVQPDEEDNKTKSGIYVPETTTETSLFERAEVVKVGGDLHDYSMESKEGDILMVNKNMLKVTDKTFKVNFEPHYFLREEADVYGWV